MPRDASPARPVRRRAISGAIAILALAAAAAGFAGCGEASPKAWNVLLVTLDTTRADRLGCYGHGSAKTPVLDGLAAEGALFESAAAQTPLTLPSHASILTGVYPPVHGARGNGLYHVASEQETLAEILARHGYGTAAVIASFVLDRRFGLDQGFDLYDDDARAMTAPTPFSDPARTGPAVTHAALAAADSLSRDRPYFLWVHYFDPHAPYTPPPQFRAQFPEDLGGRYDAEIASVDDSLGRLLEGLRDRRLLRHTLIVVVGDHGEGFPGPHAEETHGIFVYEDTMRVPLIVHAAGAIRGPIRSKALVRQIDIVPTILDFLGIEGSDAIQGTSFLGILEGGDAPAEAILSYGEATAPWDTQGWSPLYSVRDREWKFIEAPKPELYHLTEDAEESRNLIEREAGRAERYRAALDEIRSRMSGGPDAARSLSPEDRERLRKLGYVLPEGAPTGLPEDLAGLTDPKDVIHVTSELEQARKELDQGQPEEGVRMIEAILAIDPTNIEANRLLANRYMESGRFDLAEARIAAVLEVRPTYATFLGMLGDIRFQQQKYDDARDLYERAAKAAPGEPTYWGRLGNVHMQTGSSEKAEACFREALAIAPKQGQANFFYARLLASLGRPREAVPCLENTVESAEASPEQKLVANLTLVSTLLELREPQRAAPWIERLIRDYPQDPRVPEWRKVLERIKAMR